MPIDKVITGEISKNAFIWECAKKFIPELSDIPEGQPISFDAVKDIFDKKIEYAKSKVEDAYSGLNHINDIDNSILIEKLQLEYHQECKNLISDITSQATSKYYINQMISEVKSWETSNFKDIKDYVLYSLDSATEVTAYRKKLKKLPTLEEYKQKMIDSCNRNILYYEHLLDAAIQNKESAMQLLYSLEYEIPRPDNLNGDIPKISIQWIDGPEPELYEEP